MNRAVLAIVVLAAALALPGCKTLTNCTLVVRDGQVVAQCPVPQPPPPPPPAS